jgi:dihydroorotase
VERYKILNCRYLGLFFTLFFLFEFHVSLAQKYDFLIKGGNLIDPANGINARRDVAIKEGKISKISESISETLAEKTIDAHGLYISPGFIDMHTHVFVGSNPGLFANGVNSVSPDDFTFRSGVTTVVDAGTSGWKSFPLFKKQVIDQSKTRIFVFLNIAGEGMTGGEKEQRLEDMNADSTASVIAEYQEIIVGVKIGHYNGTDWAPFDRAVSAAEKSGKPLFVECHLPQYPLAQQLGKMRPGDVMTHSFEHIAERTPFVGDDGTLLPVVLAARKRGILFDLGHGGAGFWFDQAKPAAKQDFFPDSFGTDLHRFSMNSAMKDMTNVMSKFMALGLDLNQVVQRATWNAARAIHHPELGNLSEGAIADLVILRVREGTFGFTDSAGNTIQGNKKLEAEVTLKQGKVVWDLNGITSKKQLN